MENLFEQNSTTELEAPPERADSPPDYFERMSPNELQQWREAEDRFVGVRAEHSNYGDGSPFSGHS